MPKLDEVQQKWVDKFLGTRGGVTSAPGGPGGPGSPDLPDTSVPQAGYIDKQLEKVPLQKISPADVAKRREGEPDWDKLEADRKKKENQPPATKFDPNKKVVQDGDYRTSGDVEHAKLPPEIQEVLDQRVWSGIDKKNRWTLVETFSRLKAYGLWGEVKRVVGVKDKPERHVEFRGYEFAVAGNSGGILYEAKNAGQLAEKMLKMEPFGEDGSIIGALHKGQRSMREWSDDLTSLHISIGPKNFFDAHIDKVAPTKKPQHGKTQINLKKGLGHQAQEVWPEMIRKETGIPGVIVEGSVEENKEGRYGGEVKIGVKIELKFPVDKQKKDIGIDKSQREKPLDDQEALKTIMQKVKQVSDFPLVKGVDPGDVPTREAVATIMASEIMEAARKEKGLIQLNLPYYLDHTKEQTAAAETMRQIGVIARAVLGSRAEKVRGLTVTFGSMNQKRTVSIAD